MFEIVIGLTVVGLLFVAVIEILDKCEHRHADAEREARWHHTERRGAAGVSLAPRSVSTPVAFIVDR